MFALGRVIGALTSSALLATSLVAITVAPAQAAIENCGIVTYDDSLYGSQTLTPTATNGMCILKFDGFASTYQSQEITNLRLPSFVSSIAVEGVGGGGSSAVNMTNWLNGYFSGFDNSYTLLSDSGGGGGGGANFGVSSFSVTSNYVFGLKPGNAGLYDPSFTESGNANWTSPYLGNDGGSTVFSYTSAGVTKSITANGGKAPLQGSENTGGTGGTVVISGVTGFNTANGTTGLSRSSNNPSPYGGTYRGYLSSDYVGAGGGSSANYAIGTRGQGYGSGGSGAFIEDGQMFPEDLGCYQNRWAPNCDGQPGSIALAYSPTNYYPVSWEPYSPLWFPELFQ